MKEQKVLNVKDLCVYANNKRIVCLPRLEIEPGEIVLLTGVSGSGKTTLLRSFTRIAVDVYRLRVEGRIELLGHKLNGLSIESIARNVWYVPQEPWYAITTPYPIYEITALNRDMEYIYRVAKDLGIHDKIMDATINLSAGEVQRILFLEALLSNTKLVLLDEITSYLDEMNRSRIVWIVKALSRMGISTIVVDHNLDLWIGVATKVLNIENGVAIEFEDFRETPMYSRYLEYKKILKDLQREFQIVDLGKEVIRVRDLWYRYPDAQDYILKDIGFDCHEGEIVWIKGVSGSGKSTLLKVLAGIYRPSRGCIDRPKSIQLVPENPFLYLSAPTTIEELDNDIEIAKIFNLQHVLDTPIMSLSSGERKRLALASAYRRSRKALLVDEPSIGLDPINTIAIFKALLNLVKEGLCIVIASHLDTLRYISRSIVEV